METTRIEAITGSLRRLPSRRDVLRGFASVGLTLSAGRDAAARKEHHKKHKKKPRSQAPSPPPLPFNEFGCLDVGQVCQGDSTLCCSGICDPGTSTCVAHNSGICFPDTDPCTVGVAFPCNPNNPACSCVVTTGKAAFCANLSADIGDPVELCRFCSQDADCQEEFGPGAACVLLRGICSQICASTDRTACVRPCA
jgi:hypothetical protein